MKRSRSKSRPLGRVILFVEAIFISAALLAACNRTTTAPETIPTARPVAMASPQAIAPAASPTPAPTPSAVTIFKVENGTDGQWLTRLTVPPKGSAGESVVAALNQMSASKDSPLPSGTKALSVKFGSNGLATADFNAALKDNFKGGDEKEALMLNAILATVGQFPDVKKVQILVEGEKVSIGGTQDTTEPLDIPSPVGVRVSQHEGQP